MEENENGVPKDAEFAFLVIKGKDGRYAIANVNNEQTERQPGLDDVYAALSALSRDIDRQALALAVVSAMNQMQGNQQGASSLITPEKKFVKRS